jgi:hypothetical protein
MNIIGEAEQPEVVLKAYRKVKVQLHAPAAYPRYLLNRRIGETNWRSISSWASGFIPTLQPLQLRNQLITTLLIGGVKHKTGHSVISHKAIRTYGDLPPLLL